MSQEPLGFWLNGTGSLREGHTFVHRIAFDVYFQNDPLTAAQPRVSAVAGSTRDITDRERMARSINRRRLIEGLFPSSFRQANSSTPSESDRGDAPPCDPP